MIEIHTTIHNTVFLDLLVNKAIKLEMFRYRVGAELSQKNAKAAKDSTEY